MAMSATKLCRVDEIGRGESQPAQFSNRKAEGEVSIPGQWREKVPRWDQAIADGEYCGGSRRFWIGDFVC